MDIHGWRTKKDSLMKERITKDYFGFLLHLELHYYNELVYDYTYNDVMLI
jgi:hypothetical protein